MGVGSLNTNPDPASAFGASVCIVGGAGFIGSHIAARLLSDPLIERVVIFDNFSSGRKWHLSKLESDSRLRVDVSDARDLDALCASMSDLDSVVHLASNPDIAKAATQPTIDFDQGTLLTNNVIEAMRRTQPKSIFYASGSGVYGDVGYVDANEDLGPLIPVSTYGASKLAGEALIASYCYMFDLRGWAFRFGNVVGPHQTHGVGFDFVRRLIDNPKSLAILGDGNQSKSYIHVSDVIDALLCASKSSNPGFAAYNVATGDYVTVREIAEIAIQALGIKSELVNLKFGGGDRGWKGDVPIVRLNTDRIRSLGWSNKMSTRDALRSSIESMIEDTRAGLFDE